MTISDAKERVSIPYLWSLYGYEGNPLKSCKSPFRDESNSSFSVFADGTAWKDHGTGEGGDSVTFIQMAEGLSKADACRKIISYAGEAHRHSGLQQKCQNPRAISQNHLRLHSQNHRKSSC